MKKIVSTTLVVAGIGFMVFNLSVDSRSKTENGRVTNIQALQTSADVSTCDAVNTNECYPPEGGKGTGKLTTGSES